MFNQSLRCKEMTDVQLTTQEAFTAHVEGLMRDIKSRYPHATLEWAHVGELMDQSGADPIVEMRWGLIRGYSEEAYRARMLVDVSEHSDMQYLVSPPGESVLNVEPVQDRERAIDAFLTLVEPGR